MLKIKFESSKADVKTIVPQIFKRLYTYFMYEYLAVLKKGS